MTTDITVEPSAQRIWFSEFWLRYRRSALGVESIQSELISFTAHNYDALDRGLVVGLRVADQHCREAA